MKFAVCFTVTVFTLWSYSAADAQDVAGHPKLVICGGGALPEDVYERFCELAGPDPKLIVIPTASQRPVDVSATGRLWGQRGFGQVVVLHANDPNDAKSDQFAAPLRTATAVWFGGGSQQRIADAYLGTPVEQELKSLLRRGGVIGGTSAGAAVQSRVMIASGREEPRLSMGFDLMPHSIVDQHFLRRNRVPRLIAAVRVHPHLVGWGIDEGTALVAQGGALEVVGESYVMRIELKEGEIDVRAYHDGDAVPAPAIN